jgi:hypothetical protein
MLSLITITNIDYVTCKISGFLKFETITDKPRVYEKKKAGFITKKRTLSSQVSSLVTGHQSCSSDPSSEGGGGVGIGVSM